MYPDILAAEAFAYMLVFTRIGAMIVMMPGLGERMIPTRIRLVLALGISFLIYMLVGDLLPTMPASPFTLAGLLIGEVVVGLMIGTIGRMLLSALHVAGSVLAVQTGLAAAQQFDPTQGSQGALMAGFLTLTGITLIMLSDLHHLLIGAMDSSYHLFPPGGSLPVQDMAETAMNVVARSFAIGMQLAAPFMVYGLIFYIGIGIIARLMPTLQIFFIAMPLNIMAGFAIMMLVFSAIMAWFTGYFESQMSVFLR
jgi:flagellar biosynthetic protein FliR